MSNCKKCGAELPAGAIFCAFCGVKQIREKHKKQRGNGEGSVFKLPNGRYRAVICKYYFDEKNVRHKRTKSKTFATKKEAVAALPTLNFSSPKERPNYTWKALYDAWLPTHQAGKSTLDCYKSAFRYFSDLWFIPVTEIDIDDLQSAVDECPKGKRTKQNMKAVAGLLYKYAIPRHVLPDNLNLAQYIAIRDDGDAAARDSFTDAEIAKISAAVGKVPYADYVYCMIYLGFRPSEFLALQIENYDAANGTCVGGAKTEAGKDRTVTISPKIAELIKKIVGDRKTGPVFLDDSGRQWDLKRYSERAFYPALEAAGIDNPIVTIGGNVQRHRLTPHSCRHTFATLMKRVGGADKDKLALIGHTSDEMLRYYQDVSLDDLRKITDNI